MGTAVDDGTDDGGQDCLELGGVAFASKAAPSGAEFRRVVLVIGRYESEALVPRVVEVGGIVAWEDVGFADGLVPRWDAWTGRLEGRLGW